MNKVCVCDCVCKQREKITYGKEDKLVELSWKKDTQWILFDWGFVVDRFGICATDQHFV